MRHLVVPSLALAALLAGCQDSASPETSPAVDTFPGNYALRQLNGQALNLCQRGPAAGDTTCLTGGFMSVLKQDSLSYVATISVTTLTRGPGLPDTAVTQSTGVLSATRFAADSVSFHPAPTLGGVVHQKWAIEGGSVQSGSTIFDHVYGT